MGRRQRDGGNRVVNESCLVGQIKQLQPLNRSNDTEKAVFEKIFSQKTGEVQAVTSRTGEIWKPVELGLTKGSNPILTTGKLITLSKVLIRFQSWNNNNGKNSILVSVSFWDCFALNK